MDKIYKKDTKGRLRSWVIEVDGGRWRTVAGLVDGKQTISEWTICKGKNLGRASETTPSSQAVSEAQAKRVKQLKRDYYETISEVDNFKHVKPMLAKDYNNFKDDLDYRNFNIYFQPKLDGVRCIITAKGAFSRGGEPMISIPHILEELEPIFKLNPDLILDGEVYNHELKDDFEEIISIVKRTKMKESDICKSKEFAEFHCYDMPDSTSIFSDRVNNLGILLGLQYTKIVDTRHVRSKADGDEFYDAALEEGYEGGIYRVNAKYEFKRSSNLLKRKDFVDEEFEILEISDGKGNWAGAAKSIKYKNNDGTDTTFSAGFKGSRDSAKEIYENRELYTGCDGTVVFFGRTNKNNVPRFGVTKIIHKTKRI